MNKLGRIIGVIVLATFFVVCSIGFYLLWQWQPVKSEPGAVKQFIVPKGQSITKIAARLKEAGLIRNQYIFRLWVKLNRLEPKLQAGSFNLDPGWSPAKISTTLTQGTDDYWITIPEGWRREEIADSISNLELTQIDKAEFLQLTEGLEGTLFPDTYLVPREISTKSLVGLLTSTYEKKITLGLATQIKNFQEKSGRDFNQALILASLVQREAKTPAQMRLVAGILWNRIEINMPLQVDATLQYAKGYDAAIKDWWSVPLLVDKEKESPYNTYLNPGLPPAPISNPGLEAIKAVLEPESTKALFYLHDAEGNLHSATTLQEHNRNVNTYLRN